MVGIDTYTLVEIVPRLGSWGRAMHKARLSENLKRGLGVSVTGGTQSL